MEEVFLVLYDFLYSKNVVYEMLFKLNSMVDRVLLYLDNDILSYSLILFIVVFLSFWKYGSIFVS